MPSPERDARGGGGRARDGPRCAASAAARDANEGVAAATEGVDEVASAVAEGVDEMASTAAEGEGEVASAAAESVDHGGRGPRARSRSRR